jgi:hypothetical protein
MMRKARVVIAEGDGMDNGRIAAGALIVAAWGAFVAHWRLAAFTLVGVLVAALIQVAIGIVVIAFAQAALSYALLAERGLPTGDRKRFIALFGVQAVTFVIVSIGWMLFLLPGLYLMLRLYFVVPSLIVEETGVFAALGVSWRRTAGQEVPLFLATIVAALPAILSWALLFAAVGGEIAVGSVLLALLSIFVTGVLAPLFCTCVGTVGYADLGPDTRSLAEIFS